MLSSTCCNCKIHTRPSGKQTPLNQKHTDTKLKKTQQSLRGYIKKKKNLISARRDEAPVSAAAPATTEKHQETTTQLNTPSLFNYCHIITAIYLRSHQTNTHGGKHTYSTHTHARTHTRSHKTTGAWASSYTSWVKAHSVATNCRITGIHRHGCLQGAK